jgi:hypothetical protein
MAREDLTRLTRSGNREAAACSPSAGERALAEQYSVVIGTGRRAAEEVRDRGLSATRPRRARSSRRALRPPRDPELNPAPAGEGS